MGRLPNREDKYYVASTSVSFPGIGHINPVGRVFPIMGTQAPHHSFPKPRGTNRPYGAALCAGRYFPVMKLGESSKGDRIVPGEPANMPGSRKRGAGAKGDGLRNEMADAANIHVTAFRFCRGCQFAPPFVRHEFVKRTALPTAALIVFATSL